MRELTARLRTVLHRTVGEPRIPQAVVIGELSLNLARRLVQKSGNRIHLTPKEFELLHCLMTHPGIPVSYSRLIHTLWGEDYATQMDGLRTLVRQLRKKIENDPAAPRYILTESRIGYRFADPEDWLEDSLGIPQ
jgi:two-component system KDP operon response regulator KdpE